MVVTLRHRDPVWIARDRDPKALVEPVARRLLDRALRGARAQARGFVHMVDRV